MKKKSSPVYCTTAKNNTTNVSSVVLTELVQLSKRSIRSIPATRKRMIIITLSKIIINYYSVIIGVMVKMGFVGMLLEFGSVSFKIPIQCKYTVYK